MERERADFGWEKRGFSREDDGREFHIECAFHELMEDGKCLQFTVIPIQTFFIHYSYSAGVVSDPLCLWLFAHNR